MTDIQDMAYTAGPRQSQLQSAEVINVTPNDSTDLAFPSRAIRCEGAGDLAIVTAKGTTVTCKFKAGETRWLIATRINATGTTATGIEAMR